MINADTIKTIKEQADIKDILQELGFSLNAKNAMPCPIHGGKDNNFTVKNGIGTCWSSCGGQHWDAVGFLMDYKDMTYPEAIQFIANIYKIPVQYQQGENAKRAIAKAKKEHEAKEVMYIINENVNNAYFGRVHRYFIENQKRKEKHIICSNPNLDFTRSLSLETLAKFEISIAPDDWQFMTKYAENNHLDKNKMLEMGILAKSEGGKIYDFFRGRVIIPIHNHQGKIVGFTGRKPLMDDNKKNPKYKNSPESLIYQKKAILYGLYQNMKAIKKAGEALLIEGNMDVVGLYNFEVRNAVATGGTALTFAQARLLKKYTDNVTIIMDGDEAGINAMRRAIPILTSAGLNVKIALLPTGEDPDSFIRKQQKKGWDYFLETESQIAVEWIAREEYGDGSDPYAVDIAIKETVNVISKMKEKSLREKFSGRVAKILKVNASTIKEEVDTIVKREIAKKVDEEFKQFNEEQRRDILLYGFYEENNAYYKKDPTDYKGKKISNFTVKPLFLVKSQENKRLFEITNEHGETELIVENTKVLVSVDNFRSAVENVGDFIFDGDKHDFMRIKRKIYVQMTTAIQLNVLGHHPDGFWAWANGLFSYKDLQFHECDEYGIVEYDNKTYYLPALSIVNEKHDESEEDEFEDEKAFYYQPSKYTFEDWSTQFVKVHGDNGKIGFMYYFTMLYRDYIFKKFLQFPHINGVGPTGSGKSFMMWSIVQMFGKRVNPFMLKSGTDVAFFNRWTRFRNGFAWHDEYFNDIAPERVQYLKYASDGTGRERGQKTSNRSLRSQVLPAIGITGQDFPTIDPALFNRCINLAYSKADFTNEERKEGETLVTMQNTNSLSGLTSEIAAKREIVISKFDFTFDAIYTKLKKEVEDYNDLPTRLLRSNVILLSVFKILSEEFTMPFDFKDAYEVIKKNMLRQANMLGESSEVNEFFDVFKSLLDVGVILKDRHFKIWTTQKATVVISNKSKATTQKTFDFPKELFCLSIHKVHPLYLEASKKQGRKKTQDKATLQHYLRTVPGYVGECRNIKKIGYCFLFEMDKLELGLKDGEGDDIQGNDDTPYVEDTEKDLPF